MGCRCGSGLRTPSARRSSRRTFGIRPPLIGVVRYLDPDPRVAFARWIVTLSDVPGTMVVTQEDRLLARVDHRGRMVSPRLFVDPAAIAVLADWTPLGSDS
jgi:hypothetical protein